MKTPPVHKVNFPLLNFLGYTDCLCSVVVGVDLCIISKWRQTDNFFQTPRLTQAVPLVPRNLSDMFVCELVVLDIVIFLSTLFRRSAILLKTSLKEYFTGVVSSVCKSISALKEHCMKVVSHVHDILCPGIQTTLASGF